MLSVVQSPLLPALCLCRAALCCVASSLPVCVPASSTTRERTRVSPLTPCSPQCVVSLAVRPPARPSVCLPACSV